MSFEIMDDEVSRDEDRKRCNRCGGSFAESSDLFCPACGTSDWTHIPADKPVFPKIIRWCSGCKREIKGNEKKYSFCSECGKKFENKVITKEEAS